MKSIRTKSLSKKLLVILLRKARNSRDEGTWVLDKAVKFRCLHENFSMILFLVWRWATAMEGSLIRH